MAAGDRKVAIIINGEPVYEDDLVAGLPAAFGVEGRLVEEHEGFAGLRGFDERVFLDEREDLGFGLEMFVAFERGALAGEAFLQTWYFLASS